MVAAAEADEGPTLADAANSIDILIVECEVGPDLAQTSAKQAGPLCRRFWLAPKFDMQRAALEAGNTVLDDAEFDDSVLSGGGKLYNTSPRSGCGSSPGTQTTRHSPCGPV